MGKLKLVSKTRHGEIYIKSFPGRKKVNHTKKRKVKRRRYNLLEKLLVINLSKQIKDLQKLSEIVQIPQKTIWEWTHTQRKKILKFQRKLEEI